MLSKFQRQNGDHAYLEKSRSEKINNVLSSQIKQQDVEKIETQLKRLSDWFQKARRVQDGMDLCDLIKKIDDQEVPFDSSDFLVEQMKCMVGLDSLDKTTGVGTNERFFNQFHTLRIHSYALNARTLYSLNAEKAVNSAQMAFAEFDLLMKLGKDVVITATLLEDFYYALKCITKAKAKDILRLINVMRFPSSLFI
jgi:hypothetical protein